MPPAASLRTAHGTTGALESGGSGAPGTATAARTAANVVEVALRPNGSLTGVPDAEECLTAVDYPADRRPAVRPLRTGRPNPATGPGGPGGPGAGERPAAADQPPPARPPATRPMPGSVVGDRLSVADRPATDRPATDRPADRTPSASRPLSTRPTLADVAALAGVSTATASRVLNGTAKVSGRARADVEEAVHRLSYVRQRARGGVGERSCSVAAVVCEDNVRVFADSFFSRVLIGASQVLPPGEGQLALLVVRGPADYPAVERHLARGHADGVLLISSHGRDPLALTLQALGIPAVLAGRPLFASELPYVDADNRGGARAAVAHLVAAGRRTIASIAGPPDMAVGVDRLAGYRDAVAAAGVGGGVVYGDFSQASGEHAMTRLLDRQPNLDAVFAASDLMALGALRALKRAGRQVPDDVAVVGFDDAPLAQHTDPRLTTVRQPVEEMGAEMTRQLLRRITGAEGDRPGSTSHAVLDTELVVRDSA